MTLGEQIGHRVRQLRAQHGWTLEETAKRAGTAKSHLWAVEDGRSKRISLELALGLADTFECSLDELIGRNVKPHVPAHLAKAIIAIREASQKSFEAGQRSVQPSKKEGTVSRESAQDAVRTVS